MLGMSPSVVEARSRILDILLRGRRTDECRRDWNIEFSARWILSFRTSSSESGLPPRCDRPGVCDARSCERSEPSRFLAPDPSQAG